MTVPLPAGVAIAAACALLFHPSMSLPKWSRWVAILILACIALVAPMLVPGGHSVGRFMSAVFAMMMVFKMIELCRLRAAGLRLTWSQHWRFVANVCSLSWRTTARAPHPPAGRSSRQLMLGLASVLGAVLAMSAVYKLELAYWLEHCLIATALLAFVIFELEIFVAITRLLGGPIIDANDRPWLAVTPADFWRRYNRLIGGFLHDNVFRPADGKHHPERATLLAFAASGLMHEYVFWIAIERSAGLQMLFFMAQGIGVVLTARIKPRGAQAAAWRIGTWGFMLLTSVVFFASFHHMFPIYRNGLPAWLAGW